MDYRSTCKTLNGTAGVAACLAQIAAWSDAHPRHVPITVKLEVKQQTMIEWLEARDAVGAATVKLALGDEARPGPCACMCMLWTLAPAAPPASLAHARLVYCTPCSEPSPSPDAETST